MSDESIRRKWLAKAEQNRREAASTPDQTLAALLHEIADTYDYLAELSARPPMEELVALEAVSPYPAVEDQEHQAGQCRQRN